MKAFYDVAAAFASAVKVNVDDIWLLFCKDPVFVDFAIRFLETRQAAALVSKANDVDIIAKLTERVSNLKSG